MISVTDANLLTHAEMQTCPKKVEKKVENVRESHATHESNFTT